MFWYFPIESMDEIRKEIFDICFCWLIRYDNLWLKMKSIESFLNCNIFFIENFEVDVMHFFITNNFNSNFFFENIEFDCSAD